MSNAPIPSRLPVLVVDDEELYLRALVADFSQRGYEVTARRDLLGGETAYREMERQGTPPLLVVDLIQPGENGGYLGGLDLLRRLRPSSPQAVALTDSDATWLTTSARSLGAQRVVRKPDLRRVEPEHLDQSMSAFLAELAGESGASPPPAPAASSEPDGVSLNPLLGALEELRHVRDRASVLLLVMRLASELAARGILYEVEGDHLRGLGSFGLDEENGPAVLERTLPLDLDTLPGRAFWSARIQRVHHQKSGPLGGSLPEPAPEEAVAMPILGPGGVAAVIYADSGPNGSKLQDLRSLAALVGTASMALDKLNAGKR